MTSGGFMQNHQSKSADLGTHWILIIGVLTVLAFFINIIAFLYNLTDSVANLFLIPVIVATFLFQKKGLYYTLFVMAAYLVLVFLINTKPSDLLNAGEHAIMMSGIALIITLLSIALHDSEKRYRLLFETSPAPFIVTDPACTITDVNENFHEVFGYEKDSLIGKPLSELSFIDEESRTLIKESVESDAGTKIFRKPLIIHIDDEKGSVHTCRLFFSILYDEEGDTELKMMSLLDITDNVIAEKRIKLSLKEKEMLLKEVHHRVKNNLQVIISILKLQYNRTADDDTRESLKDCQARVYSMALVHEKMYRSDSLAIIDIKEYLSDLSKDIIMEYSELVGRVTVSVTAEKDLCFDLDTIVPCALITSELLTNSLKYAFPEKRKGHITIDISGKTPPYIYTYRDDGVGIPPDYNPETSNTLGVKIVKSLTRQMHGDLSIKNNAGTEIIINFPIEK